MNGYTVLYGLAVLVTLASAGLAAVQAAGGTTLGIDARGMAWLGIFAAVLGVANGFLPSLRRPPDSSYSAQASDPVRRDSRPPGAPVEDDADELRRG